MSCAAAAQDELSTTIDARSTTASASRSPAEAYAQPRSVLASRKRWPRRKLLPQFDYLSTVSGGGYLGAFMSNQFPPPQKPEDGAFNDASIDSVQVRHLRNNSKYLLPATAMSRLALAGILISGILTTTLLATAIPVLFALITHWVARTGLLSDYTLRQPLRCAVARRERRPQVAALLLILGADSAAHPAHHADLACEPHTHRQSRDVFQPRCGRCSLRSR